MDKKRLLIALAGTALVGSVVYLFLRNARRQNQFNELMMTLDSAKAQQEGNLGYLSGLKAGYEKEDVGGKSIILYKTAKVEELVDKLYNAFKNRILKLSGTDEDAIFTVYNSIENQKKMAQVATRYKAKYGDDLAKKIESELNDNERSRLFAIIQSKPAVQYV